MRLEWDFKEFTDFANNLTNWSRFEREMQFAAKEIAGVLLRTIKTLTPTDKTWQLINGWNGNDLAVRKVTNGFEVVLVNKCEYATWVNDGHKAYNQYGGPYEIHNRVKVKSPHKWQKGNPTYYVFGHFFVERGILQLDNTQQVEEIIMKKLQKWWESV